MMVEDKTARLWLLAPWLALALALPSALASLPPFRFGYWDKAEPIVVWLHVCGGIGALGLAAGGFAGGGRLRRALAHPYVLAALGPAVWSLAVAPFVPSPLLQIAGVPQSGLGVLWFLDLAVLIACGLAVREDRLLWRLLVVEAILAVLAVSGIKLVDRYGRIVEGGILLYVPSYYGWPGVVLPVIAGCWQWRRRDWPLATAALATALVSVFASFSLTAWGLLIGGGVLTVAGRCDSDKLPARLSGNRLLALAAVSGVALLIPLLLRVLDSQIDSASLRDRIHLQDMVLAALRADPAWLLGHGWGRVQDAFHAHLNVTGEVLWRPTWIFLSSDYFSAHNWLLDTLHATGLPGVILQLAIFLAVPWYAARPARAAATALSVALGLILGVWFMVAFSLPFFALAMAAVAGPAEKRLSGKSALAVAAGLLLVAALQFATAAGLIDFGRKVSAVRQDFRQGLASARPWPADPRGSDLEVVEGIRDAFGELARAGGPKPEALPAVRAMFDVLRQRIPETGTVQAPIIGLGILSYIHFSRELAWLEPELADSRALWRPWLERLLVLAPGRSDQAVAYLTDRAVAGDLATVTAFSSRLLASDAGDPVGLYFRGLAQVLSADPAVKRAGIESFRAARAAGIERFLPMDPAILALLGPA
jgi:O-antigen ligase